ncbi:MAG: hypothetical protein QM778_09275 [Myxococcales bacterium]
MPVMSGSKLNLRQALVSLGVVLATAVPAAAQSPTTGPVTSFPPNVAVKIDGDEKAVGDRLFVNRKQCFGSQANEGDAGTGAETADDGGTDAGTSADAGTSSDGGVNGSTSALKLITKATTGDGAPIQVTLTNLNTQATQATVMEFWMGMGSQDCFGATNRTSTSANPGKPACKKVGEIRNLDARKQVINFTAQELFTDPYSTGICTLQGLWTLWLVPLTNPTPVSGTPENGIGTPIYVKFEPDFTPLAAVTSVKGGRGETQVTVSWNMASGANSLTNYHVYFDTSAPLPSGSGPCTSSLLVQGQNLPLDTTGLKSEPPTKGTSITVNPDSLNLDFNQRVATAVVSVDAAGNESEVSNVVCVERVSTTGFWDACNMNGNCKDDFNSCSLSFGDKSRLGWLGWSLGALGVALWLRRRRTV